ncbi:hypothetical protein [uncultured Tenacibaculum sp.]|uniref:hypothetical protein n=1 Tax=uncultured Tenacibaculum sp. TaxID=174713 RepID=UPI002608E72C|nr:hypothetical protein [uncultured Tenacibaculum sp.]
MKHLNLLHKTLLFIFAFVAFSFTTKNNATTTVNEPYRELVVITFDPELTLDEITTIRENFKNSLDSQIDFQYIAHPHGNKESWLLSDSGFDPKGDNKTAQEDSDEDLDKPKSFTTINYTPLYTNTNVVQIMIFQNASIDDWLSSLTVNDSGKNSVKINER